MNYYDWASSFGFREEPRLEVMEQTLPDVSDDTVRTIRAHLDARQTGILVEESI